MRLTVFLMFTLLFQSACNVLFWRKTQNYNGGFWLDQENFFEVEQSYEAKASWYPLNQNVRSRNYISRILECSAKSDRTRDVLEYDGWTLPHSLQGNRTFLFAIRGLSDDFGSGPTELIAGKLADRSVQVLSPVGDGHKIWLKLSGDGAHLILTHTRSTMESPTGKIVLQFFRLPALEKGPAVTIDWSGAPAPPPMTWARGALYLQREADVLVINPDGTVNRALEFPRCFFTETQVSPAGRMFFRTHEGERGYQEVENWIHPDQIPFTTELKQIGAGCP
ncbi:MAG: hypothetical protein HS115_19020 [Spirochaetales bacterium]|nr:hypothetical protein [Spirochaetales bacterium]